MADGRQVAVDPAPTSGRRWQRWFLVLLMLGMGLGPFITFGLGALSPLISTDLGLSSVQVGALPASQAMVAGLTSGWVGRLADRRGGRFMLLLLFATGGLGIAVMALSPLYVLLLVGAAVTGFCLAASNPSTNLLVRAHLPVQRQGTAMGMKQSGVTLTVMVAGVVLPSIGLVAGWRAAVGAGVGAAVIGLVATVRLVPPDEVSTGSAADPLPSTSTLRGLRWMSAATALIGAAGGGVSTFMPLYAVEQLGASVTTGGLLIAVQGVVGMVCRIAWGRRLDGSTNIVGVLMFLAATASLATLLMAAASSVGMVVLWCGAALFGASGTAWNSVAMLAVVRSFEPRLIGAATGVVFRSFFAGALLGPLVLGVLVDHTGTFLWSWLLAATLTAGAASIVGRRQLRAQEMGLFEYLSR